MDFMIELTQEHIDNGTKSQYDSCPIALCLIGAGYDSVYVFGNEIVLDGNSYNTSDSVEIFTGVFDDVNDDENADPRWKPVRSGMIIVNSEINEINYIEAY